MLGLTTGGPEGPFDVPVYVPVPVSAMAEVAVTPVLHRTYVALEKWEQTHDRPPSLRELAKRLGVSHTAVRKSMQTLVLLGLVKHEAGKARDLKRVEPAPALKIVGRVGAGDLVEWYEQPAESLDLGAMFHRPGWVAFEVGSDRFAAINVIAGDVLIVDDRGDVQGVVRDFRRRAAWRAAT